MCSPFKNHRSVCTWSLNNSMSDAVNTVVVYALVHNFRGVGSFPAKPNFCHHKQSKILGAAACRRMPRHASKPPCAAPKTGGCGMRRLHMLGRRVREVAPGGYWVYYLLPALPGARWVLLRARRLVFGGGSAGPERPLAAPSVGPGGLSRGPGASAGGLGGGQPVIAGGPSDLLPLSAPSPPSPSPLGLTAPPPLMA